MTFLPFETLVIETPLTKAETIVNLTLNIESEHEIRPWNSSSAKAFEGHLRGNEFELKRIINYRNSFLPVVKGRLETLGNGTRVTIDMRLQMAVIIFMIVWTSFCIVFFIGGITDPDSKEQPLIAAGMLLSLYLLTMGGYLFESYRTKEMLLAITKGRVVRNP